MPDRRSLSSPRRRRDRRGLIRGFLGRGYRVVVNSRSIKPDAPPDVLALAERVIGPTVGDGRAGTSNSGGLRMRADIVPGAVFPDYELPDHTTKHRKLSALQGPHPMVLVLSRGGYCSKDRRQHEGLLQLHREIEVGYCRLVTVSTDNITATNEFRSGVGAHWPFLSDPARKVQKDLDIAEYTDPGHDPMIPHTIVLESGLVIYKIYTSGG